jgi:hypothetical protein
VDLSRFSRDELIMGGLALLLVIDLLFLPWFDISVSVGAFSASATFTATGAPDGWLGILAVLCAVGLIAHLVIERLGVAELPPIAGGGPQLRFYLAIATAVFVALKFLFHIHFDSFGIGFWIAVVLTVGLVYEAMRARTAVVAAPMGGGGSTPGGSTPPPA